MFYALATGKLRVPGIKFTHILSDIESLNQAAQTEKYDVTAVSVYAYPFLADKYILLDCGASFGEGYGPIVVSSRPIKKTELKGCKVAIPGTRTTSYLALKLFEPGVETVTMPFDKILDAVKRQGSRSRPADPRRSIALRPIRRAQGRRPRRVVA